MIEILRMNETKVETRATISFEEIKEIVGGYVECNHTRDGNQIVQALCNEDGESLGLAYNALAQARFAGRLLMGPRGAVGNWVVLSGKDMLD